MSYVVVTDACVLFSYVLRDLILEIRGRDLYRCHWSKRIQNEYEQALMAKRPPLSLEQVQRITARMNEAYPDALLDVPPALISAVLGLPDPDDAHVVALAVHAGANAIVTFNLRDFASDVLDPFDLELIHPDDFLLAQFDLAEAVVVSAAATCRKRSRKPAYTADNFLDHIERAGLPKFAARLLDFRDLL